MKGHRPGFPMIPAATLADAGRIAATLGSVVAMDLDGTLVSTGTSASGLSTGARDVLLRLRESGCEVVIVSNGTLGQSRLHGCLVVEQARKPWTRRNRLGDTPDCVVGDQYLTDGLLAARLRVPFVQIPSLDHYRRPLARLGDRGLAWLFSRREAPQ